MPVWEVSEPTINMWLYDQPLGYQPGLGNRISFKLAYKQRDVDDSGNSRPIQSNIFSLGYNWNCAWSSYVVDNGDGSATMFLPGGGTRFYYYDGVTQEYYSHTIMNRTTTPDGTFTGFIVSYANGAQDNYQSVPQESLDGASEVAFLSAKVDQFGQSTQFLYQDTGELFTLQQVIDPDGRTNTLYYANANPSLITSVQDPFGHSIQLQYDENTMLTNITDVMGLSSSMQYDSLAELTSLYTPYGTTTFEYFTNDFSDIFDYIRAVRVDDAGGGTNVYMLREQSYADYNYDNGMQDYSDYAAVFPGDGTPVPLDDPTANPYIYRRDSFHWGPRQAAGLPSDLTTLSPTDYLMARMRHWLHSNPSFNPGAGSFNTISQTLEMEQAPSPDGVTFGQTTWYAYDGQGSWVEEGYDSQPALVARLLPDGTTWYVWYQRDDLGRVIAQVETYSASYGADPQTRTKTYIYDDNDVNLVQYIGPLGETTSYGYDDNNQLLFVTNALNEVSSYTYDAQGRLASMTTPAGLTTMNSYYNSGPGQNFLQTTIDLQIQRTNSYTYANDLVATHTDERGLTTTFTWDALNRLRCIAYPNGSFVTNSYNRLDLVRVQDRMGFITSYGYDSLRRMTAVTNALGNCTLYNYCPCGGLESVVDAATNVTSFTYDNAGDRLTASYPDGYVVYYNYDLFGRVISTVDSGGITASNWYNNQGLRYAVSNAVGQVSLFTFDVEDRFTNLVDANSVSINSAYDLLGRIQSRSYPDGGMESYGYTLGIPAPTSFTNQIGEVTCYAYDAAGRKMCEANALNYVTSFNNSPAGDLLALTDGNGRSCPARLVLAACWRIC